MNLIKIQKELKNCIWFVVAAQNKNKNTSAKGSSINYRQLMPDADFQLDPAELESLAYRLCSCESTPLSESTLCGQEEIFEGLRTLISVEKT